MNQTSQSVATRSLFSRLGFAGAVLLLEYLAISFRFDAKVVAHRGGAWAVLGEAGQIAPLLVVAATAFLLLPLERREEALRSSKPKLRLLGLHLALLAAFVFVTSLAFGGVNAPPGPALAWLLGWTTLGVATAASLLVGLIGEWRWLLRTLPRATVAGGTLGLAAWVAGTQSIFLWAPLTRATFLMVEGLLRLFSFQLWADRDAAVMELEGFAVAVAPECSGVEGIGLFVVLMSGFLYWFRTELRFPRALWLLPIGILAVWCGNAVRIALLMLIGARIDPEIAVGSFHTKAGWVFFCVITLGVAFLARRSRFFSRSDESDESLENPTTPLVLPLLSWIGVSLATSTFSDGHDPLYGVRVVVTGAVIWMYRSSLRQWWQRPTPAAWIVGGLVGVAWLLGPLQLSPPTDASAPPFEEGSSLQHVVWIAFRCLGAVAIIPLIEELAFRGYLARWITRRDFWEVPFTRVSIWGLLGSSLAFGLIHEQWLLGTLTGLAYGLLVRRSGRLVDAIAAHAASNLVIAIWVLATGSWQHW